MEEQNYYTIILRHDTSTKWLIENPVLALGEYGVEDDTHKMKRGNGVDKWADLPFEHFGLEQMLSFENIIGEVNDNEKLKTEFDSKISVTAFNSTSNKTVSGITILSANDAIATVKKILTDINTGDTKISFLNIKSTNNSIIGGVSAQPDGTMLLDLKSSITVNNIGAEDNNNINLDGKVINVDDTAIPKVSIKTMFDATNEKISNKLDKSSLVKVIYGTDDLGNQTVYDIDSFGKVNTVNNIKPDEHKNIQLSGTDINIDNTSDITIKSAINEIEDKTNEIEQDLSNITKNISDSATEVVDSLPDLQDAKTNKLYLVTNNGYIQGYTINKDKTKYEKLEDDSKLMKLVNGVAGNIPEITSDGELSDSSISVTNILQKSNIDKIIETSTETDDTIPSSKAVSTFVLGKFAEIAGGLVYKGALDATNPSSNENWENAQQGYFFKIGVAGTIDTIEFAKGDSLYLNTNVTGIPTHNDFDKISNVEITVIDNLLSSDSMAALSANQGRILNELINTFKITDIEDSSTIKVSRDETKNVSLNVELSSEQGNKLSIRNDGLYVPSTTTISDEQDSSDALLPTEKAVRKAITASEQNMQQSIESQIDNLNINNVVRYESDNTLAPKDDVNIKSDKQVNITDSDNKYTVISPDLEKSTLNLGSSDLNLNLNTKSRPTVKTASSPNGESIAYLSDITDTAGIPVLKGTIEQPIIIDDLALGVYVLEGIAIKNVSNNNSIDLPKRVYNFYINNDITVIWDENPYDHSVYSVAFENEGQPHISDYNVVTLEELNNRLDTLAIDGGEF